MKLARFTYKGEEDWGIVNEKEQTILSSLALEEAYFCELPKTIVELIQQGEEGLLLLSTTLTKHAEDPIAETYSLSEVTLLAPLIPQKNIFCVGKITAPMSVNLKKIKMHLFRNIPSFFQNPLLPLSVPVKPSIFTPRLPNRWTTKVN